VVARYGERTQGQEVLASSSFYSASDRRLHFGLGPSPTAGPQHPLAQRRHENSRGVAADQLVVIREGSGIVRTQKFTRRS
jgi:hypothetical protein